jgi:hypothetical protein
VEACPGLTNPVWTPLAANTLTADTAYFTDPQWKVCNDNYSVLVKSNRDCLVTERPQCLSNTNGVEREAIFLRNPDGRRAVSGDCLLFNQNPKWRDLILFHEDFYGDTGRVGGARSTLICSWPPPLQPRAHASE